MSSVRLTAHAQSVHTKLPDGDTMDAKLRSVDGLIHRQTHSRKDLRRTGSLAYGHGFNDESIGCDHQDGYLSLSQKKALDELRVQHQWAPWGSH